MTINQAIKKLQEFAGEGHGEVELCSLTEVDESFRVEFGRVFDLIELEAGSHPDTVPGQLVCAYLVEPDQDQMEYPKLRVIK